MSRPPSISQAQVDSAAAKIQSQGHNVTVSAVRKALGRGSATTISRLLKDWRQRATTDATDSAMTIPSDLLDALSRSLTAIHDSTDQAYRAKLETLERSLADRVEEGRRQSDEILTLKKELSTKTKQAELLEQIVAQHKSGNGSRGEQDKTVRSLEAKLKKKDAAIAKADQRIAVLTSEKAALKSQLTMSNKERIATQRRLEKVLKQPRPR